MFRAYVQANYIVYALPVYTSRSCPLMGGFLGPLLILKLHLILRRSDSGGKQDENQF